MSVKNGIQKGKGLDPVAEPPLIKLSTPGLHKYIEVALHYYPPHSGQSANENATTYMECDSCWVPNRHNGPARALLTRYLSNTVQQYK